MATDSTLLQIGPAIVSVGAYVTAGGAGTLVDAGHTSEPVEIPYALETIDRTSERSLGVIATKITGQVISINIPTLECKPEHVRIFMAQPAANLTGGTLEVGDAVTQYHQIQLVQNEDVAAPYTSLTITLWRCQLAEFQPLRFGKGEWTILRGVFRVLRDDSVAAAGKYMKAVWA
jgi:hypothetical protein